MHVEIPAEFEPVIQGFISQGTYRTEEEVVTEALRALQRREQRLVELRREVQLGIDQLERGEYTDYDERSLKELFEQIKAEGRQQRAAEAASQ